MTLTPATIHSRVKCVEFTYIDFIMGHVYKVIDVKEDEIKTIDDYGNLIRIYKKYFTHCNEDGNPIEDNEPIIENGVLTKRGKDIIDSMRPNMPKAEKINPLSLSAEEAQKYLREHPCPDCGAIGLHGCTGKKMPRSEMKHKINEAVMNGEFDKPKKIEKVDYDFGHHREKINEIINALNTLNGY